MDIVVKLRFAGGHYGQAQVTTARYRWKAPAQVKRDQARSATYKQQQHAQRTIDPSTVDKQPCLSTKAHVSTQPGVIVEKKKIMKKATKSTAKPRSSRSKTTRLRITESNADEDGDIEQIRGCGLTPEPLPSINVSAMSLDTCTPTPHSYMHVSDNCIYALSPDAAPLCHICVPRCSRRKSPPWRIPVNPLMRLRVKTLKAPPSLTVTPSTVYVLRIIDVRVCADVSSGQETTLMNMMNTNTINVVDVPPNHHIYVICELCVSMGMDKKHRDYMTNCVVK